MQLAQPVGIFLHGIRFEHDTDARFVTDRQETFAIMLRSAGQEAVGIRTLVSYIPGIVRKFLQYEIRRRRGDLTTWAGFSCPKGTRSD